MLRIRYSLYPGRRAVADRAYKGTNRVFDFPLLRSSIVMQPVGVSVDGETCSHSLTADRRAMVASLGNVHHVALMCGDQRHALDQVIDLAFHDVPELGVIEMEVAFVGFRRR